ncbi:MAG: hypothetical protein NZ480_09355 [Bdellovibrionaceae bacterium]|nr:hypothetical protein [Pseudobdellovibrionaceae bacterium]MDW8189755.1 hypothetical protein [Pseudobdellovibrionaceae bacterium]
MFKNIGILFSKVASIAVIAVTMVGLPLVGHSLWQGAMTAATGYAGVAVNEGAEGGLLNPATVAQVDGYYLRLSGGRPTQQSTGANGYLIHVTDNTRDILVPASLIYQEFYFEHYWPHRDLRLNLGLAHYHNRRLAVGIALGYQTRPFETVGPETDRYQFYGNLGFNFFVLNHWSWGFAISSIDQRPILGTSYILQRVFRFRLDWKSLSHIGGGLEVYLGRWFILRLGYLNLLSGGFSGNTWGLGFVGPRLSVQYAWAPLMVQSRLDYTHWIDLSLRFW